MAQRRVPEPVEVRKTNKAVENLGGTINELYLSPYGQPYSGVYEDVAITEAAPIDTGRSTGYYNTTPGTFTKQFSGAFNGGVVGEGGPPGTKLGYITLSIVNATASTSIEFDFFMSYSGDGGRFQPQVYNFSPYLYSVQTGSFSTTVTGFPGFITANTAASRRFSLGGFSQSFNYGRPSPNTAGIVPLGVDQMTLGVRARGLNVSVSEIRYNARVASLRVTGGDPV